MTATLLSKDIPANGIGKVFKVLIASCVLMAFSSSVFSATAGTWLTEDEEKAIAANIVGPTKNDDNCSSCHALETEAWQNTRHFATFKDRHRTDRAKEILANMGEKSMKRAADCRQCHYTSELKKDKLRASFGVTCESCHGAAKEWLPIHSKGGGDLAAPDLKWGTGKSQDPANRSKRLAAAEAKGMINSEMIYDLSLF